MATPGSQVGDPTPLEAIAAVVAAETGEGFYRALVRSLASTLGVEYAFVSEFTPDQLRFRTLAVWGRGSFLDDFTIPLAGTPCEAVLGGNMAHHPRGLRELFPADVGLATWGAESYCGVPILGSDGHVVGHLAIMHDAPMPEGARLLSMLRILAMRVRAELERQKAREALAAAEAQYRDLYDEAPVAYFTLDDDGRILRVNRRAAEFLALPVEQVVGQVTSNFTSPTSPLVWNAVVDRLRSGGRVDDEQVQIVDAGGAERWMRFSAQATRDASGRITEIRIAGVDVTEAKKTERVSEYLQEEIKSVHNFEEIVGRSPALGEALRKVELVAATESSVLILGETGTGKELFARAIHSRSPRRERPLIKVNCAALPTGLIESELFGHERGAFTGAAGRRIGRFELANGGTLFLDEIGELPLELQAKLLRVLQDQEFERVGGSVTLEVDVRVIAATNRDLLAAVAQGTFRQDLFYRLNVFPIRVPALRERRDDVPLLVHYFLNRYAMKAGRRIDTVPRATMERLVSYSWPGNVRELENVIERAVILSAGAVLEVATELLPTVAASAPPRRTPVSSALATAAGRSLDDVERDHIRGVLESCGWRIEGPRGAARELNLSPSSLRRRIQKLRLSDPRAAASR